MTTISALKLQPNDIISMRGHKVKVKSAHETTKDSNRVIVVARTIPGDGMLTHSYPASHLFVLHSGPSMDALNNAFNEPLAGWEQNFLATGRTEEPAVGCFPSRGTYYLFVRGYLTTRFSTGGDDVHQVFSQHSKYFRFVGAFPPGDQWTHMVWLMEAQFGEKNVTYRFGKKEGY